MKIKPFKTDYEGISHHWYNEYIPTSEEKIRMCDNCFSTDFIIIELEWWHWVFKCKKCNSLFSHGCE